MYLRTEWFSGRDENVRARSTKMVTTRKPKWCCGGGFGEGHEMPAGSRMLEERAIFDGSWASWALCTGCMDEWLIKYGGLE